MVRFIKQNTPSISTLDTWNVIGLLGFNIGTIRYNGGSDNHFAFYPNIDAQKNGISPQTMYKITNFLDDCNSQIVQR